MPTYKTSDVAEIIGIHPKRSEVTKEHGVSVDTLRNWEMNGLITVKRKENGYRVYSEDDIRRLKIIRSLRCANYSPEAILRLLKQLSENPDADVYSALNTPRQSDDIISVCDRLIFSGATVPIEVMPDMMQIISFFPITQGIMLMKSTFLNLPVLSPWVPVSVMSGVAIACGVVSVKFFKWE